MKDANKDQVIAILVVIIFVLIIATFTLLSQDKATDLDKAVRNFEYIVLETHYPHNHVKNLMDDPVIQRIKMSYVIYGEQSKAVMKYLLNDICYSSIAPDWYETKVNVSNRTYITEDILNDMVKDSLSR